MTIAKHCVVFVVGPTGSGKTRQSLYLAHQLRGRIINADSLQMYKGMNIGTAKPDWSQYPHIPHHLFDSITPPNLCTAGQYEKLAKKILKKYSPLQLCFVVGGSGFYLQALEKGCYPVSKLHARTRENLQKELKTKGVFALYQELQEKDFEYSQKIHSNDSYRIIRALGVIRSEKKKMSAVQKTFRAKPLPYFVIKIGMTGSTDVLKKRVTLRTRKMLQEGWIEEVQTLLNQGLENFLPMNSVGYKEVVLYLTGKLDKSSLEESVIDRTMRLIKKQKTWFKRDSSIRWYDCETDPEEIFIDLKEKVETSTQVKNNESNQ